MTTDTLEPSWAILNQSWPIWKQFGIIWGPSWAPQSVNANGWYWMPLEGHVGEIWRLWGVIGSHLGAIASIGKHLGAWLGYVGLLWNGQSRNLGHPGANLMQNWALGAMWSHLEAIGPPFGGHLGAIWGSFLAYFGPWRGQNGYFDIFLT